MNKRYLYLALIFILSLLIGGKWNLPLAAWLLPVFVIRFFRESDKAGRNFLLLWLVSAAATIIGWNRATATAAIHPNAEPVFFILIAPIGLLPYIIDRLYARRFPSAAWVTLVYPIAATAIDFFSASGSPFGTFGAAAYTQRGFLPAMQIASVFGLWGITFVMSWFASLINHLWENGFKFTRLTLTSAGLLALILVLGVGRILLPTQPKQTATVAGFSLPNGTLPGMLNQLNGGDEAGFRQAADKLHAQQLEQIRKMADEGADIVSLQEGAGLGTSEQVAKFVVDASAIAKEKNIYIILPVFDIGATPPENKVHIIDPNGDVALTHVKYGGNDFEGTLKGDGILQAIDTPYGKLSAVICWDADFPNVIKQAGEQNVDLLFVPSNDWLEVKDIHSGMAAFRAVENGVSIFRQTGQGVSSVVDVHGRELNRVDSFKENASGFAGIQVIKMQLGSVNTLYPSVGDLFGNVMLIGLVGLLVGLWFTRNRQ
ncbi:MAG: apolipoprotein N-acyltransferase [Anaerolineales bacterium]